MNYPSSPTEAAVARWISGGFTSLTHPVLARIQADCFGPLGIEAAWFEAEPFSGLEAGFPDGWLRAPRWNPARMEAGHPAAGDLGPWVPRAAEVTVTADGILRLPLLEAHEPDPWLAVRHSVAARSRARALLCAAAGSLLFDPEAAAIYLAGNDEGFFQRIAARLEAAKTAPDSTEPPTDRTVDESAGSPAAA